MNAPVENAKIIRTEMPTCSWDMIFCQKETLLINTYVISRQNFARVDELVRTRITTNTKVVEHKISTG